MAMSLEKITRKFFKEVNKKIINNGILTQKVKFNIPKYVEKFFRETKENISAIHLELDIPLTYEVFSIGGHSDKDEKDLWIDSMIFDSKIWGSSIPEKPNLKITLVFDTLKISSYTLFEILEDYKDVFEVDFSETERLFLVKYKVEDFEFSFINGNYL